MDPLEQLRTDINRIDRDMADLFEKRMETVKQISAYKRKNGLPVLDRDREADVLARNGASLSEDSLLPYYIAFQQKLMDLSKQYQADLAGGRQSASEETAVLQRGALVSCGDSLDLRRNVMIVTDEGVPARYVELLFAQCRRAAVFTVPRGEDSKSFAALQQLLERMLQEGLTRNDCVVAIGGGMVGDLAGFAAAIYMRGIDFYNVPTTLLAQVDSSVGGKTAINFSGVKNPVGAFYPAKKVLIDPDVLGTLPRRQFASGLAEMIKMALTCDRALFERLEDFRPGDDPEPVIQASLGIKMQIVAADARERSLRRVLNFGHTIGHAIESTHPDLLHGECVALGMIPMCAPDVARRLRPLLRQWDLPTCCRLDRDRILEALRHDKKTGDGAITAIEVPEIGRFTMRRMEPEELMDRLDAITEGADRA